MFQSPMKQVLFYPRAADPNSSKLVLVGLLQVMPSNFVLCTPYRTTCTYMYLLDWDHSKIPGFITM